MDRRATSHFRPDPVPDEYLDAILQFAAQAPSGYNLQPWRFVVVRDRENRERLKKAAYGQEKVGEAPVIIIAFGICDGWKAYIDAIFQEGVRRGFGKQEMIPTIKQLASDFLEKGISKSVWINRHTMIAVTTMMLVAETYGLDTAPMEGFDPVAVKREFNMPDEAEVVALLAIGFVKELEKPYAGRLALDEFVYDERYGQPWNGKISGAPGPEISEKIDRKASEPLQPA